MLKKSISILIFTFLISHLSIAQINISNGSENFDYSSPKEYVLGGITIEGTKFLDHKTLIQISNLEIGSKIEVPGDALTKASRILWEQGLFSDIQIKVSSTQGNTIFLTLYLEERPRLSKFKFEGIKKSEIDAIREKIKLARGKIITKNVIINTKNIVSDYYKEKGFLNVTTEINEIEDTVTKNHVILVLDIEKGDKVKIGSIEFAGNEAFTEKRLKRLMKDTKEKKFFRIFKSSKYLEEAFKNDKQLIIEKYNEKG